MQKTNKVSQISEKRSLVKLNEDFFVVAGEGEEGSCQSLSLFFHTFPQCFLERAYCQ